MMRYISHASPLTIELSNIFISMEVHRLLQQSMALGMLAGGAQ